MASPEASAWISQHLHLQPAAGELDGARRISDGTDDLASVALAKVVSSVLLVTKDEAANYAELPPDITRTSPNEESLAGEASVESTIQSLFLNTRGQSAEDRLRGKTVTLENSWNQTEQQKQQTRHRRQVMRKKRRLGQAVPLESDKRGMREGRGPYGDYLSLHEAWTEYMMGLLFVAVAGGPGGGQGNRESEGHDGRGMDDVGPGASGIRKLARGKAAQRLLTADLHGCMLRVVDAKCRSDVGIEGIVVRESKSAFHLIMRSQDKVKTLPKMGHVFAFDLERWTFKLHGDGLVDRNRALLPPSLQKRQGASGSNMGLRHLVHTLV